MLQAKTVAGEQGLGTLLDRWRPLLMMADCIQVLVTVLSYALAFHVRLVSRSSVLCCSVLKD